MGSHDFDRGVERQLTDGGVEVHYYHLPVGRMLGRLRSREHEKLVVVDGRVGLTGGFDVWKVWQGNGLKPDQWRDTNVRVEGPAVRGQGCHLRGHDVPADLRGGAAAPLDCQCLLQPAQGHSQAARGQAPAAEGSSSGLKEREYRDEEGNIHHHTHTYMEQHGGEDTKE